MHPKATMFGIGAALAAACSLCLADGQPGVIRIGEPARDKAPQAIRLSTYNIENLFDDRDDLSLVDREDDWYDKDGGVRAKPASQQEAVARAIRAIDSDIIGVQEVESYDALIEFRETHLKGLGYDHAISVEVGSERGIECGILSRFPIREVRVWPQLPLGGVHPEKYGNSENWNAGQPIVFRRSPLFVRVEVPAGARGNEQPYELSLFIVHHKSGKFSDYWRDKESAAVIGLAQDLLAREPDANIAILGDFNAEPADASVQAYINAGFTHAHQTGSDGDRLTHSSGRAIDFILVNANLKKELIAGAAFAFGTPVLPEDADWRTTHTPSDYASDHMAVSADLTPIDG